MSQRDNKRKGSNRTMGMAASQARLLTITARIHDIEYKAQCLQNAKILLSQLEDEAYQKFLAAQDGANTITVRGEGATIGMNLANYIQFYGAGLRDNNGNPYISDSILEKYKASGGDVNKFIESMGVASQSDYRYENYNKLFQWISINGGDDAHNIKTISDSNANDPEWLANAIASGWTLAGLSVPTSPQEIVIKYDPGAEFNYQVDSERKKEAVAQASAEYEATLRKVDRKDKMYDTELSKLESERNALTKEYDSLKKVIEDNIERTFGIFS